MTTLTPTHCLLRKPAAMTPSKTAGRPIAKIEKNATKRNMLYFHELAM